MSPQVKQGSLHNTLVTGGGRTWPQLAASASGFGRQSPGTKAVLAGGW